ncbi:MAG: S41 family peptidase [Phycisphaeraceae bacterium]
MNQLATAPLAFAALLFTACAAGPADPPPHPLAGKDIVVPDAPQQGQVDLPRFPSISPDGKSICFSWRGDLWRVDATGGQATRLTAHPMLDDLSVWSPDGKQIAFNSDRDGFRNVYRMNADGSVVSQVTREDRYLFVHDWADDGTLALTGYLEADVHKNPRPYAVGVNGGPITRLLDAFGRSASVSPDGKHVAFVRGRAPWERPFLTNSDNRELWLYDRENRTFQRLTTNPGNDGKPRWLDNNTLLYLSARPPARVNLYKRNIKHGEDKAIALTAFMDDDVQHFDVARGGQVAVLHVWDTLYTLDLKQDDPEPKALTIAAATDSDDLTLVKNLAGQADEAALSPDGKVMAVSTQGEIYVRTVDSKDPPQRVTHSVALDEQIAWSPDGRWLYFTSDRDGTLAIYRASVTLTRSEIEESIQPQEHAAAKNAENKPQDEDQEDDQAEPDPDAPGRWHNAVRFAIEPVVVTPHHDSDPSPSPTGETLAFRRGNGTIVLLNLETGEENVFLESWDSGTHWAWSSDGRHLAVSYEDQDHNADIWVGPADASKPLVNITKHPSADVLPSFSHDGKVLSLISSRSDDQYDVYAVYLDKDLETYTPQQLDDYYKQAQATANKIKPIGAADADDEKPGELAEGDKPDDAGQEVKPAKADEPAAERAEPPQPLDLEDAYLRLRRLTSTDESEWDVRITPAGDRVVFSRGGSAYSVGWDGSDEKKIGDNLDPQHLSLTGDKLVAVRGGGALVIPIGGGEATQVQVGGSIRIDRRDLQKQRFLECARAITMNFYDGSFKGIDWAGATKKYALLASRTWTADEFDDVANRYLGLLNASHMGIRSPQPTAENSQPNGRLGASYERVEQGYRVVSIEPQTPAAEGVMRLRVGDVITAIGFKPIRPSDTVTSRLVGRVGLETAVTVLRQHYDEPLASELHLLMTPISYRAYDDIRYDNWQLANKAKVDKWSNGRLGYIHIESMNASSLAEFERDLYAACEGRDGLIIDVRDNGGGWTTDRLLASIMTRRHAYTVPRGADPTRTNSYPNSRLFITRYNLPINALCNENSFSNAEIFSHAFKTLGRGTLVGNTTAGGVISTGGTRLLDGTTIRLPFRGWYLPDGTDMENHGAVPDLRVPQTPEDESAGKDAQLEAAVADLLKRL